MGCINTAANGNLYFEFRYKGQRCREYTKLADSPTNRRRMQSALKRIEAEITLDSFDYASYFPNSKRAKKFAELAAVNKPKPISNVPEFKVFATQWFDEHKVAWRNSYITTVETIVMKRLIPTFGKYQIDEIKKANVMQFRAELSQTETRSKKAMSANTVNRHIKILIAIINDAADRYDFRPISIIKPIKEQKSDIRPFSLDEVKKILENVREDFKPYFTIRFFSGMRTAEIDGLKWKYVDLNNRLILVRETIIKGEIEYTKTDASQREIVMSQPVYEAFIEQKQRTKNKMYVFCNRLGNPLDHQNVTKRVWYPLLRHLKLERRNPYQMRHTAATLMLAAGEAPEFIARQLGHSTTAMLFNTYSRYVPNLTRQDGSAFNQLLEAKL